MVTENMSAVVEETSFAPLDNALDSFIKAAITLLDAIDAANAEELISVKYPFDKSFDELVWDMLAWKEAVLKEERGIE